MPTVDVVIESPISTSIRAAQVSAIFDVPAADKVRLEWHGEMPIEDRDWRVGLIVGPSGSGKSTILRKLFAPPVEQTWGAPSVIDDFPADVSIEDIANICQSVGFNTVPAWLRPYAVLSTGEKFRVEMARRLVEGGELVTMDEFTSVVDRQVARIGAHAVQKWIRKRGRRFVAATCHYDLEDWLQPDWVFEPATMSFRWRSVQRRPDIECVICRVDYNAWQVFAPFHYLTASLHRSAKCYVLFVDGRIASFVGILYRPHPIAKNVWALSRSVTLPDFQGMGLAFALSDKMGAAFKAIGRRLRSYPSHPAYIRKRDRSPAWALVKKPGIKDTNHSTNNKHIGAGSFGGRPCAVFEYCGPAMADRSEAVRLIGD